MLVARKAQPDDRLRVGLDLRDHRFVGRLGQSARTRATRSRTSFAAESTSRSGTNSTVIWLTSSRDTDFTVRTPSMPEIESSIGWVICDSITCGLAPLYTVRTETTGVSIFGYSRTDRRENEIAPSSTIIRLITVASTGRRMQSSGRRTLAAFLPGISAAGLALGMIDTCIPGTRRCVPSVTIRSPAATPFMISTSPTLRVPVCTWTSSALPSTTRNT